MEIIFWIGRIILGGYFIYSGYQHFLDRENLTTYAKSKNVPLPKIAVIVTGLILVLGGVSILTGFFVFIGLWALVLFLVAVSLMMHAFWKVPKGTAIRQGEEINFFKNIALAGSLMMIIAMIMY